VRPSSGNSSTLTDITAPAPAAAPTAAAAFTARPFPFFLAVALPAFLPTLWQLLLLLLLGC
jgi:hypothetical protein